MITLTIATEQLSDNSTVYRVVIHDENMPPGECISIDCVDEWNAVHLQQKIAYAIEEHTNEIAECRE